VIPIYRGDGITLLSPGVQASRRQGKSLGPIYPVWPLTVSALDRMFRPLERPGDGLGRFNFYVGDRVMKVRNSLKSAKLREKGCRIVRRRGRVYVINKRNPRFKARQG
tara:strand:- start:30753 stop:31076 length:324 start_codon:yes stop_codon:yes gene_type:complete